MAKTFNQFIKKLDELYWPKGGDEAKFMAMHGPYSAADVGGKETHDDAVFKGTIVQKDHTKLAPSSEEVPGAQSELNDLIKNIHSRDTDELLRTVSHLNLSTDPKHREHRDVINKELMYRYKNHSMSEELIGGQKNLDVHPDGRPDGRLTAKDFAILRARKNKNKNKMNEELGFKPVKITVGPYEPDPIYSGRGGYRVYAHDKNGKAHPMHKELSYDETNAQRDAARLAAQHGLKADRSRPYGHFIENEELNEAYDVYLHDEKGGKEGRRVSHSKFFQTKEIIDHLNNGHKVTVTHTRGDHVNKAVLHPGDRVKDKTRQLDIHPGVSYQGPDGPFTGIEEGKLRNAFKKGMERYKGKSKSPLISAGLHAFQTLRAAKAAKMSNANPNNFDKFMDYANARNQVREEAEVEEAYGSGMKYYTSRRRGPATSPLDRPDVKQALNKPRVDNPAIKDIEDKIHDKFTPEYMKQAADNATAERKRQVDAEKKKRGIAESDNKSRKIAGAFMRNEEVNFNTEEIHLEDGNVMEIDIELAEAIADLFDSLDEDDQDALAEMLHTDIDSFMEVVDLLENDGE